MCKSVLYLYQQRNRNNKNQKLEIMTTLELSKEIKRLKRVYFNDNTTDEEAMKVSREIQYLTYKLSRLYVETGQIKSLVGSPYGDSYSA